MRISVRTGDALQDEADLVVLFGFEDEALPEAVSSLFETADFTAKPNKTALVYWRGAQATAARRSRRAFHR